MIGEWEESYLGFYEPNLLANYKHLLSITILLGMTFYLVVGSGAQYIFTTSHHQSFNQLPFPLNPSYRYQIETITKSITTITKLNPLQVHCNYYQVCFTYY